MKLRDRTRILYGCFLLRFIRMFECFEEFRMRIILNVAFFEITSLRSVYGNKGIERGSIFALVSPTWKKKLLLLAG